MKTMEQRGIALIVVALIVLAVLALGAGGYYFISKKGAAPEPASQQPSAQKTEGAKVAEEKAITPLHLEYSIKNFGPTQNGTISYYFESTKQCNGRSAYLGLMKIGGMGNDFQTQYAKVTAYADNGQLAISQWKGENDLAFDDAKPTYNDLNIPLVMNEIFAYAGKNFNAPENWTGTEPILLKDVVTGRSKGNYSIVRQDENTSGVVPCTNFKIFAKASNMDGTVNVCVAKKIGEIKLPFVVSLSMPGQGPSWELKSFSSERSGVAMIPQCLDMVSCAYVAEPQQAERSQCDNQKGRIASDFDDKGCILKYKCMAESDDAREAIGRVQPPSCGVNQAVLEKYLECRKNKMPNFDPSRYDNSGCLLDMNCRP